jgi:hypothetical protein
MKINFQWILRSLQASGAPRISAFGLGALSLVSLGGCRRAPSIGIYGSYFPGWLICLAFGITLAAVTHLVLRRLDYEVHLQPLGLVYICLSTTLTCVLWLTFFF